jgi:hypothetical protein
MAVGLSKGRVWQKKKYGERENHAMAWIPTRVLYLADGHCSSNGTVAFFFPFLYLVKNITLWSKLRLMWIRGCLDSKNLEFWYCNTFVCIWQLVSNNRLIRFKRFVSWFTTKLCN